MTAGVYYNFRVTAVNLAGESLPSIATAIQAAKAPDSPVNLAVNQAVTTATQIGITWSPGAYNGGSPVISYSVSYKLSSDATYTLLSSSLTSTSAIATQLLTGAYYTFYV